MPRKTRWLPAPWWRYAVPFAILNLLRQLVFPPGEVGDAASIALFLATAALVYVTVTLVARVTDCA
jgi:hypothetical protein